MFAVAAGMGVALAGAASAGNKTSSAPARSAPAVHSSAGAVRAPGLSGGGVHLPGSMGGGAHLPGNMAGGGAHLPSSMAGGAHLPSSMAGGAHVPSSMAGGAHLPASMARPPVAAHVPGGTTRVAVRQGGYPTHSPAAPRTTVHAAAAMHEGVRPVPGHETAARAGVARSAVAERRPAGPATVMRGAHGALILAGGAAGAHAAMARPYLHPELHANMVRDHAEVEHDRAFVHMHQADFHTNRVHDFNHHELEAWRHGLWRDEWHYGRRGWWWETDGVWYPYGDPVFPYPLVVAPLAVYDTTEVEGPPPPYAEDAPPGPGVAYGTQGAPPGAPPGATPGTPLAGIAPLPAPPPGWYRCGDPAGYYPTVGACNGPWTLVQEAPPASNP
jgi:hypothetical protein